jgi:hypothetical protein
MKVADNPRELRRGCHLKAAQTQSGRTSDFQSSGGMAHSPENMPVSLERSTKHRMCNAARKSHCALKGLGTHSESFVGRTFPGAPETATHPTFPSPAKCVNPMKKMVLLLLVLSPALFGQTVFVAGNNKAANDIRKQLSKDSQKGKSCLVLTDDPAKAELRMEVNQGAPGSGLLMGSPAVAVSVTNKAGVIVFSGDSELAWDAVYRRLQKKLCN